VSEFARRAGAVGEVPEHYGDPIGEQRALASGAAIVDLSDRSVLTITGPERLSWLDSLTSQSIAQLAPGESAETLLLDPTGRIEYAARVLDDGETTWLLMDAGTGAGFAAFLTRMRFMLQVAVADVTDVYATVGMLGGVPDAVAAAVAAPAGVPLVWADPWAAVQRGGYQYAEGPHPSSEWDYREALVERARLGELDAVPAAGTLALEALRIAAWRPRAVTELDERAIPHEFDWLRSAVHLAKGCYRGQETVAKVHNLGHPPRRLVLLHLDGSDAVLPAAGAEVRLGRPDAAGAAGDAGAAVGHVTAAAWHHELGPIALALVKRSADPASELTVVADDVLVPAAQQVIVPPSAGATADVPRLPRLGARR